jgi:membrane protein implicated in regulation of membrane protease activity
MLRRSGFVAGALLVVALLLLITGHWVLGVIFAVASAAAIWAFRQLRTLR